MLKEFCKKVTAVFVSCGLVMSMFVDTAWAFQRRLSPQSFNRMYGYAAGRDASALRWAISKGLDINGINENGDTGLCVAVRRQDRAAYNTFLAVGASPNVPCRKTIPYWNEFADPVKAKQLVAKNIIF